MLTINSQVSTVLIFSLITIQMIMKYNLRHDPEVLKCIIAGYKYNKSGEDSFKFIYSHIQ